MKKYLLMALFTVSTLLASPAFAVDLTKTLKTFDGNDFVGQDGKALGLTPQVVIENSLLSEQATTPDEKNQNFWLALKVHRNANDFTPSPEEIVRIKKALAQTQATAVYGQVVTLLDPTFSKQQ